MNISALDLNLFLVFHAVLEEGTTVRAARRLAVTQSAISNALARLRQAIGDPLFVRSGRGLVPTRRAEEMRPAVQEALRQLHTALGDSVDPATTNRTFTIACADHHQAADLPAVARVFAKRMPNACLRVVSIDTLLASKGLERGSVDVALGPEASTGQGWFTTPLFRESAGLYVRARHPALRRRATLARLGELGHIDVHIALGEPGDVNRSMRGSLAAIRFERRVAVIVPSFTTAASIASETDWVAWLPSHAAAHFSRILRPLRTPLPRFEVGCNLIWHQRTHADRGAALFRELVVATLRKRD